MPSFNIWFTLLLIAVVLGVTLNLINYLIMLERKLSAWMQDRIGPNRVGPFGLLQPVVDGIKLFMKEEVTPGHVNKLFFVMAPGVAAATALLAFAVVPFGPTTPAPRPEPLQLSAKQTTPEQLAAEIDAKKAAFAEKQRAYRAQPQAVIAPGLDIGVLFTFAITSLAVYGIVLGGWSANNKYSLLGALRSSAQLISYEIPLGMSVLGVVLICGSLNLERIVQYQVENGWLLTYQPLAFVLFVTGAFAECNRLPFDLPEAEQELVGGYHTEYSSLKWALFFLGEYAHMITTSFLFSILFLGGWHFPGVTLDTRAGYVLATAVLLTKVAGFIAFYMLVRWTIPRFRFDQLMTIAWQVAIPLALANMLFVMLVKERGMSLWWLLAASGLLFVAAASVASRVHLRTPPRRAAVPAA